jgi:acyl-CoA hydrolase
MVIGIRVEAENIRTGEIKHCNSSYFTMVAKDEDGKSLQVPGLILTNDHDIRRFAKSIKRNKMKLNRKKEFHETDFSSEEYVHLLENYKVKIEK